VAGRRISPFIQVHQRGYQFHWIPSGLAYDLESAETAVGITNSIEINRKIFSCRIGNDADAVERHMTLVRIRSETSRFHLGYSRAELVKLSFLLRRPNHAIYGQ
jgi:hypothetical protein